MAAGNVILGSETIHQAHTHTHKARQRASVLSYLREKHTHTDKLERIWQILRNVEGSEKCYAKNYIFIRDKEKAHTHTHARVEDLDSVVKVSLSFAC